MGGSHAEPSFLIRRNVEVNSFKWRVKAVAAKVIYCVLMIFYLPFYLLGMLKLAKLILFIKIRRSLGLKHAADKGKLGIASRRHKITDMAAVSTEDEYDFLVNRSAGYVWRMCFWTPQELTLFFLKEQNIKLISDGHLAYVILNTVFGHSVTWDDERNMFRLSFAGLEDIQLFEGFYWDAREILVSEDLKKIIIKMEDGKEYHSDCAPEQRPTFDLAKLHTQVCLSFMGPGLSHNHVHFLFPSTMAVLAKDFLDHGGVLFNLLSPHFRFTERINYQALRVQKATNNKRSQFDRLFFLWQPFPVIKEVFREAIAKKCKEYYLEKGSQLCDEDSHAYSEENEGGEEEKTGKRNVAKDQSKKERRTHTLFPPDFVTDEKLQKVPYLYFLSQYYEVIRQYVKDLAPFINKAEWKVFRDEVAKYIPRFQNVQMIEAISSYILKVGVEHFCDHGSYVRYFCYRYGCMSMRTPFEPFENRNAWEELAVEANVKVEAVKRDPITLIRQRDVLRTRCFLNIFVDFIDNPECNLRLRDTQYNFKQSGPQMASEKFKENLRMMDERLRAQKSIVSVPELLDFEERGDGMQLIALKDIIRTVCY